MSGSRSKYVFKKSFEWCFGGLSHVTNGLADSHEYYFNVMFWNLNQMTDTRLSGRGLLIDPKNDTRQKQWYNIHNPPSL